MDFNVYILFWNDYEKWGQENLSFYPTICNCMIASVNTTLYQSEMLNVIVSVETWDLHNKTLMIFIVYKTSVFVRASKKWLINKDTSLLLWGINYGRN